MAGIVLAVAPAALAVLPGFAPVDGGQAHQQAGRRQVGAQCRPLGIRERGAALELVAEGGIVEHARRVDQAGHGAADEVTLGGVQRATGGVDAQRPRLPRPGLLPGGQRQAVQQQATDGIGIECGGRGGGGEQAVVARCRARRRAGEVEGRRAVEAAEGVGLGGPVEVAERGGVALGAVLGALVVVAHDIQRVIGGRAHGGIIAYLFAGVRAAGLSAAGRNRVRSRPRGAAI